MKERTEAPQAQIVEIPWTQRTLLSSEELLDESSAAFDDLLRVMREADVPYQVRDVICDLVNYYGSLRFWNGSNLQKELRNDRA